MVVDIWNPAQRSVEHSAGQSTVPLQWQRVASEVPQASAGGAKSFPGTIPAAQPCREGVGHEALLACPSAAQRPSAATRVEPSDPVRAALSCVSLQDLREF